MFLNSITAKHRAAMGISVIIAGIIMIPYFFSAYLAQKNNQIYHPLNIEEHIGDENQLYLPRATAVFRGQIIAGDVSTLEYRGGPALMPLGNPFILGMLMRAIGSVELTYIIGKGIFAALIFLGLYSLSYLILKNQNLAITCAGIFSLFRDVAIRGLPPTSLSDLTWWWSHFIPFMKQSEIAVINAARFETPLIPFTFFILALISILLALKKSSKYWSILAGITFGLTFYTYFFHAMYLTIVLGLVGLYTIFTKNRELFLKLMILGTTALITTVYYWINLNALHNLPQWNDLMMRTGLEITHAIRWSLWQHYLLFILLFFGIQKLSPNPTLKLFLSVQAIALILMYNVQVILGIVPQPDHWLWNVETLIRWILTFVCLVWLIQKYASKYQKYLNYLGITMCIGLAISTTLMHLQYATNTYKKFTIDAGVWDSLLWINHNLPQNAVIATPSLQTNTALLLHTHTNILVPHALHTLAPNAEIADRFLMANSFFNIPTNLVIEKMATQLVTTHLFHHTFTPTYLDSSFNNTIPPRPTDELLETWEKIYTSQSFTTHPRVDYLYLGPYERALGAQTPTIPAETIYNYNGVHIYKLK